MLTEAGGLAADEVEQYVTFPLESSVNGLPGVRRVRSASAISLSLVWVEFDWGEDLYRARQLVAERLATVKGELPPGIEPEIGPITSVTGEIMLVSLSCPGGQITDLELRALAEFDIRNKLLSVAGVAQVVVIGGDLPEYQVNVRQDQLRLYDLSIQDVAEAAAQAHSTASAGYLPDEGGLEVPLRQTGRVTCAQDIRQTVIRQEGSASLTIGQVADVELRGALRRGTASDRGTPAVVLSIQKAPGTNTLALTEKIDKVLLGIEPALPAGVRLNRHAFRQADFIQRAVDNVLTVCRDAAIIVAVILVLFLLNVRTTIITLTALPLSLAVSLLVLWAMGMTINVMTLGGLAVVIGELVDDAIIFVENAFRRLRENRALPENRRRSPLRVIYDACNEIRGSVVFATIIIALVFVPLLFLQGLEGRFFRPLGIAYIVSLLASLLVALTVTPAMCRLLLRGRLAQHDRESVVVRGLKWIYEPAVRAMIRLRVVVLSLAVAGMVGAVWLAGTFGTSFLPQFDEGTITVFVMASPGTSLRESDAGARGIEKRLAKLEGVRSVIRRTGRAERDEHAEPVSNSEIDVTIADGHTKAQVRGEIDKILASVPGVTTMVGQPIEHRISNILSGTPAAIAIDIYGPNLAELRQVTKRVAEELKMIPAARDVAANRELLVRTAPIRYRHEDLARWGLTPTQAAEQVSTAFYGKVVAEVNAGIRRYDIVVRLSPEKRQDLNDVRSFLLRGAGGQLVRLSEVADVGPEQASNLIARQNTQRKAVVSCNVAEGYNLGHLVEQVRRRVDPIIREHGFGVHYGGQFEAQQSASRMMLMMGGIVVVLILMLLDTAIGSMKAALLVMINLPLALIGGIAALYITESPNVWRNTLALLGLIDGRYQAPVISVASIVGYVTLFGIAVRNGLLLVNRYGDLIHNEGLSVADAIIRGSKDRLIPILMTALVTVLGLVPIVLAADQPGGELLAPLAIVQLGGLATSSILNLLVVPAGYSLIFARSELKKRKTERI